MCVPNVVNMCLHTIHLAIDGTFVEAHYILRESPSLVTEDVFHLIIIIHIIDNKLAIDEAHKIYSKYKFTQHLCVFVVVDIRGVLELKFRFVSRNVLNKTSSVEV